MKRIVILIILVAMFVQPGLLLTQVALAQGPDEPPATEPADSGPRWPPGRRRRPDGDSAGSTGCRRSP